MLGYLLYKMATIELQKQAQYILPPGTVFEYKPGPLAGLIRGRIKLMVGGGGEAPRGRIWPWVVGAAALGGGGYALAKLLGRRKDPYYDYYALGQMQ